MNLRSQPIGTRIAIAKREFTKIETGSFWREELGAGADRVTDLPAVTLESIEKHKNCGHVVLSLPATT